MNKDNRKKESRSIYTRLLIVLVLIALLVPAVFTAVKMGVFSGEPQIETPVTTTDPDAPTLRFATDYDFCPNAYINEKGELVGLYIEAATELANRLGMKPEFKIGEWLKCREMMEKGDVDVLLGLEIFSNMEGTLRTIPLGADDLRVYGRDAIDSAAALAGKRVALMVRSVIAATYDLQCEYVEYNTNTEILQAVENGEVDYGICHSAVSSKIIEKNGLHLVGSLPIAKSYPALAVKDTQPELRDQLNETLQQMSLDGTIGRLEKKWITDFTRNKSFAYVLRNNQLFYFTFSFAIIVVICVCTIFLLLEKKQEQYINSLLEYQHQLKITDEEAVRANQSKSVFLSHMSHDIRTPLNGITGMVARIRKHEDDPKIIDDCLNKIGAASGHLLSLLNDVLDMSAFEQGKVKPENKPFDLRSEMDSISAIVKGQTEPQNITFSIRMDEVKHTRLIGSPLHLRRILLNLISNAVKYNRPGGRVELTLRENCMDDTRSTFVFTVQDTGVGMSREFLQERLYQPFTQENDNVRTEYQGTGLGMSIVRELVKVLGGIISVASEQGVGTTFTVELPFAVDNASQHEQTQPEEEADIAGLRILVVEDNALNREIVAYTLEDAGVEVVMAEDGKQAVETFAASPEHTFDAILMDIMMPVMDGIQATREIRRLPRGDARTVPIIAMTANAFIEDRRKTLDAGMNAHLAKPLEPEQLRAVLAQYCCKKDGQ